MTKNAHYLRGIIFTYNSKCARVAQNKVLNNSGLENFCAVKNLKYLKTGSDNLQML